MARKWSCVRLSAPKHVDSQQHVTNLLSTVVPRLRACLRNADRTARWSFERRHDRDGEHLLLCFLTGPRAHDALSWLLPDQDVSQVAEPHQEHEHGCEQLAHASSDLAVDIGAMNDWLPFAYFHLCELVELVHPADRGQFLFLCWQRWTAAFLPEHRVKLLGAADAWVPPATDQRHLTGAAGESWTAYLHAVRRACADSVHPHYLLYEHLHSTHARLGIDLASQALAARSTRTWLDSEASQRLRSA
ncbi:hypothetical protein FKR81_33325 [Lentzea tibetensis]|uniref:Thiopeptide-type bacteriocin biosynthesis domain-containing protein n=1 Tax=Lentzea tibetensis TaxID=2591470 RepID=A0A563EJD4_9PSEU|nr:hypothetical protein [Lentzea tibetensis]TWP46941.1 hypothetical protein FKR81_33325 [Lentzea tibetensis]